MNLKQATEQAKQFLGPTIAAAIQEGDVYLIDERAAVADRSGNAPADPGWDPTYDPFLLGAELADLLGLRAAGTDGITSVTSEGTTIQTRAADYFAVAKALRQKASTSSGTGVGILKINTGARKGGITAGEGYLTWDGDFPELNEWRSPWLP